MHFALKHGVPLVVAGTTEDKPEVNARVEFTGAGINLRSNQPKPDTVAKAVRTVLADPSYALASARISAEITAATGFAGLEDVLQGLIGAHTP
ncbi:UDP:flavonoid glycosyltransferase YjiC (YdhE family) [Arthrobacter psychrochitiniphilus]|nr:UDP:flavonoid glycosyltransferase YjiC (YdhE family) [Arthrobacter psychrochitiniphilus]